MRGLLGLSMAYRKAISAAVVAFSIFPSSLAFAQNPPAECFTKPPTCAAADAKAVELGNQFVSKIQSMGAAVAMPSAYAYCGLDIQIEAMKVCAADYALAGKPQCASIVDDARRQTEVARSQAEQNYRATTADGAPITKYCGYNN